MTGDRLRWSGVLCLLGVVACGGAQADWPMYRHDAARTGQAEGAAPTLGETVWSVDLGGPVDSAPAVAAGTVVVGTSTGVFHAVDAQTGAPRWKADLGTPIVSSPCILDGRVYFGTVDGYVHAYDLASGNLVWSARTGRSVIAPPLAVGGRIICGSTDGWLYAFDPANGDIVWRAESGDEIHAGAAATDEVVVFADWGGHVGCVRIADGSPVWAEPFTADGPVIACPVISGSRVVIASLAPSRLTPGNSTNLHVLDLTTGKRVWGAPGRNPWQTDKEGVMSVSTPATIFGDVVWFVTGEGYGNWSAVLRSVALETGARGLMPRPRGGGVAVTDSAAAAVGSVLYLNDYAARLHTFDTATGQYGAVASLETHTVSSPAISDGRLYLGLTNGKLLCLN